MSGSAFGLVPLISSKGPADIDGKNSVVKMRVYFGSPPKKQAIYGGSASAPSKKRVNGVTIDACARFFLERLWAPPKKQEIYGRRASAPSKKPVKMQSQLVLARVFF